jgi:hypothetical protein
MKSVFFPRLTIWEAHIAGTLVGSCVAAGAAFLVLQRQATMLSRLATEAAQHARLKARQRALQESEARSAAVVGYSRLMGSTGRPGLLSVKDPIMGEANWDFGALIAWKHKLTRKVNLRVQLNIQNLLNETDPLLTAVDTDTNSVYGTAHAAVPVYYTLLRPRNFVLSTTFDF